MNLSTRALLAAAFPLVALATAGCQGQTDYYSDVASKCSYYSPPGQVDIEPDSIPVPFLHPDCKAALEAILPYDDSWTSAPPKIKDLVTQAFQTILAYPLALPPQNKILGVSPYSIPASQIEVLQEEESMQKSLFNHAIRVIQRIRYIEYANPENPKDPANGVTAAWTPDATLGGLLTIYKNFATGWDSAPFGRASTIVHEARHADGYFHEACADGSQECDPNLDGAFGMEVTYDELLLHGSGTVAAGAQKPVLTDNDAVGIAHDMCATLQSRIFALPADLSVLVHTLTCSEDYAFYAALEGLPPPPPSGN